MPLPTPPRYARDLADLDHHREQAKRYACPHCARSGTLNGHGWLTGYAESSETRIQRGRRLFCSNRRRRPGCGRTCSILIAQCIRGFVVSAATLCAFVLTVLGGATRRSAWERTASPKTGMKSMTLRSWYRLWTRVVAAQAHLRTRLCREQPPPESTATLPLARLLAHIEAVAPHSPGDPPDAFTRFQLALQAGLFA